VFLNFIYFFYLFFYNPFGCIFHCFITIARINVFVLFLTNKSLLCIFLSDLNGKVLDIKIPKKYNFHFFETIFCCKKFNVYFGFNWVKDWCQLDSIWGTFFTRKIFLTIPSNPSFCEYSVKRAPNRC